MVFKKGCEGWNKGNSLSNLHRHRISYSLREYHKTGKTKKQRLRELPPRKKKPSYGHLGKYHTEATKRLISEKLRGRPLSKERVKKLSIIHKGRKRPKSTGQKIREKRLRRKQVLGYINSPETRAKISVAQKGRHHTEETKEKIQKAMKGRIFTNFKVAEKTYNGDHLQWAKTVWLANRRH